MRKGSNLSALGEFMGERLDWFEKTDPKILQTTNNCDIYPNYRQTSKIRDPNKQELLHYS